MSLSLMRDMLRNPVGRILLAGTVITGAAGFALVKLLWRLIFQPKKLSASAPAAAPTATAVGPEKTPRNVEPGVAVEARTRESVPVFVSVEKMETFVASVFVQCGATITWRFTAVAAPLIPH
eukprot:SAG11_NODE_5567_length_1521_cov_2.116737_2_plen_122_part_00